MNRSRVASALLAALICAFPVQATSLRSIGPLAYANDVSLSLRWGNALGVESNRGTPLFDTDHKAAADLQAKLLATVTSHLRQGGVAVLEKSENSIEFGMFGGKFGTSGCDNKNFFMVQVTVCVKDESCERERTTLGVADDTALPQALTDAVLEAVDQFIEDRAVFRARRAKD